MSSYRSTRSRRGGGRGGINQRVIMTRVRNGSTKDGFGLRLTREARTQLDDLREERECLVVERGQNAYCCDVVPSWGKWASAVRLVVLIHSILRCDMDSTMLRGSVMVVHNIVRKLSDTANEGRFLLMKVLGWGKKIFVLVFLAWNSSIIWKVLQYERPVVWISWCWVLYKSERRGNDESLEANCGEKNLVPWSNDVGILYI